MQKILTGLLPRSWAQPMETESREWMTRCSCGQEQSVWDAGGIRWKAKGTPKRLMNCPACGTQSMQTLYRKRPEDELGRGGGTFG